LPVSLQKARPNSMGKHSMCWGLFISRRLAAPL
jgi:hypothetical protein